MQPVLGRDHRQPHVVRLHRHGLDLLAGEGDPRQPERFLTRDKVGDRLVVVAGAVADAPAAPVERGKRSDDEVGVDHRLAGMRMRRAEDARLQARFVVEDAEEHAPLLHHRHGDPPAERVDCADQPARVDLVAHRPEEGDRLARPQQRSEMRHRLP